MKKIFQLLAVLFWVSLPLLADFGVRFEELVISEMPALQSFAFGEYDNKILMIGGRTDGLHRRQPMWSFDVSGQNERMYVVDLNSNKVYSKSIQGLPVSIAEQFASTNMEFIQRDNQLYLIGGYAYSSTVGDHITFPYMSEIDLPKLIDEIMNNSDVKSIRQIEDDKFAVTGGRLLRLGNVYYLVGGHKFTGRYNPMGSNTYIQEYTCSVRRFTIDEEVELAVSFLPEMKDCDIMHRRDFNVLPQIFPDGNEGMTAFTGVFQKDADLPFLDIVNIDSSGLQAVPGFSQYLNHYHTGAFSFFDSSEEIMYNMFFGGIAQYYLDENKELIKDDNVPFVKTISIVKAMYKKDSTEYTELAAVNNDEIWQSSYQGSSSEFIPAKNIEKYDNDVLKLKSADIYDNLFVGYLIGGISSTKPNVFFDNTTNASVASARILKVYLNNSQTDIQWSVNHQSNNSIGLQAYIKQSSKNINLFFSSDKMQDFLVEAYNINGELVYQTKLRNLHAGKHEHSFQVSNTGVIIIKVSTVNEQAVQKVIVN